MKIKREKVFSIIIAVLLILLYSPTLVWMGWGWINNSYYQHGFLIPVIAAFIFWLRRENLKKSRFNIAGVAIAGAGLLLHAFFYLWRAYWLSALTLPVVIFGIILYRCGWQRAKNLAFPVVWLFFMVPLPFMDLLSAFLQLSATHSSAAVAGWCGVAVVTTGNQLDIPGASFTVGLPCSGINSLVALLAMSVILSFLAEGAAWKRALLLVLAVPAALAANTVRISAMLLIADRWGTDAATRYFHDFSSPLLFLLALALMVVITVILRMKWRTWQELQTGRKETA